MEELRHLPEKGMTGGHHWEGVLCLCWERVLCLCWEGVLCQCWEGVLCLFWEGLLCLCLNERVEGPGPALSRLLQASLWQMQGLWLALWL